MKVFYILVLLAVAIHAKKKTKLSSAEIWQELGADLMEEEELEEVTENELPAEHAQPAAEDKTEDDDLHELHARLQACAKKKCSLGKECVIDDDDEPVCVCAKACAPETSERAMVCSTKNVTFASECELHRQKCLCHRDELGCANRAFAHAHLDYYGPCVEIKPCTDYEMSEFPLRMREWLYFVMEELASRDSLGENAKMMAVRAEEINQDENEEITETERWMIPAVWEFCRLDETHDDLMDDGELIPITAPLKGMEHCIGQFMEECDADPADGNISKDEWIDCLQLDRKQMKKIDLKCDQFHD